jgi:hypothetical protein
MVGSMPHGRPQYRIGAGDQGVNGG